MRPMTVRIREARVDDAEAIASVHVESWKTTYKGIVSETYLNGLSVADRARSWRWSFENPNDGERIFAAEAEDGTIVGFANGGRNRTGEYGCDGELYAIYLLQP